MSVAELAKMTATRGELTTATRGGGVYDDDVAGGLLPGFWGLVRGVNIR